MGKKDRYILSIILGGAIGSVVGLMLAPDKGDKTRKKVEDQAKELMVQGQEIKAEFAKKHHQEIEQVKAILKEGAQGIWDQVKELMRPRW